MPESGVAKEIARFELLDFVPLLYPAKKARTAAGRHIRSDPHQIRGAVVLKIYRSHHVTGTV
jgi:hypothetical protein